MKPGRIALLFLFMLITSSLNAHQASEKRTFTKTMPAGKNSKLEINNKHGDINITTWNKDSVFIMAEVEAYAPTEAKLRNMFDGIEVNFNEAGSLISAKTEFDPSISVILETFKGLTEKIIDYDSRVQISYYINAPDYIAISIQNQFGDISMENNAGTVSVSLSNGDFKANSLNRLSEIKLNFGEAEIGEVRSAVIITTFSEFVIARCGDLTLNSTSSRFNLEEAGTINVESRRDKIFAGEISELKGISYFSDFKIETLDKGTDLTLKYGSLDVEKTASKFEEVKLISAYSDITVAFDPSASYNFEIRHTNAFVVIPGEETKSEKETIDEDRKEFLTSGTRGAEPGNRNVIIEASRGNIYLK